MNAAHSTLAPAGAHAQHIDVIWHAMLWTCGVMYLLVLGFVTFAVLRAWRGHESVDTDSRGLQRALAVWVVLVVTGLFGLTLTSYVVDRALVRTASEPQVTLKVTANQWWWDVEYVDADPSRRIRTANEIHLPVNSQVHIQLSSNDVIHSFWVPNLHGKQDLIPGRSNEIRLQPQQTGVFRGLCAEFCGIQHAKMAFDVVVESPDAFAAWRQHQLQPSVAPPDPQTQEGQRIFMSSACNMCHAISGTDAYASVGPDLSHVASRRMLAAGALPNTREALRSWLENPQRLKPGNHMPVVQLNDRELDALVAYIGSLR